MGDVLRGFLVILSGFSLLFLALYFGLYPFLLAGFVLWCFWVLVLASRSAAGWFYRMIEGVYWLLDRIPFLPSPVRRGVIRFPETIEADWLPGNRLDECDCITVHHKQEHQIFVHYHGSCMDAYLDDLESGGIEYTAQYDLQFQYPKQRGHRIP